MTFPLIYPTSTPSRHNLLWAEFTQLQSHWDEMLINPTESFTLIASFQLGFTSFHFTEHTCNVQKEKAYVSAFLPLQAIFDEWITVLVLTGYHVEMSKSFWFDFFDATTWDGNHILLFTTKAIRDPQAFYVVHRWKAQVICVLSLSLFIFCWFTELLFEEDSNLLTSAASSLPFVDVRAPKFHIYLNEDNDGKVPNSKVFSLISVFLNLNIF